VPASARPQAENAIRHDLGGGPDSARFRAVQAVELAALRHGAFAELTQGPVSVVCGQYSSRDQQGAYGDYSWFFVAIKRGRVLWTSSDAAPGTPGEAYYSCQAVGLAH
jgi:hypothetical protein